MTFSSFLYKILFLILFFACETQNVYSVTGVITEIHKNRHELTIHHEEIPDFMMAMTMNFKLEPNLNIEQFSIGDSVDFRLLIKKNTAFADNFNIIANVEIDSTENKNFWEDDNIYTPIDYGDSLNDVTFTNMFGEKKSLSDTDGKFRFISFIFSRCPIPNMCPAAIFKQRYLADSFNSKNIKFIIISFDYLYDTPEILFKTYESTFRNYKNWHMWSSHNHINDLHLIASQCMFGFSGVEENDISHNMRSILIDPERRLIKTFDGLDWLPKDAKAYISQILSL